MNQRKMGNQKLKDFMTFRNKRRTVTPLFVTQLNGEFIIAAYQGKLSKYDILIRYRQNHHATWSRIRTPKHIHWAVDVLIKMHEDEELTKRFLDFLIGIWNDTKPIKNKYERIDAFRIDALLKDYSKEINEFKALGRKGEYSIKFLILLAKLLMIQEKTNLETAYMFKKLLNSLKKGEDIFGVVSIATQKRG